MSCENASLKYRYRRINTEKEIEKEINKKKNNAPDYRRQFLFLEFINFKHHSFIDTLRMKTIVQPFISRISSDGYSKDLLSEAGLLDVPKSGGVYILASKKQMFVYPNGKSRVFYIGTSTDLKRRLSGHRRRIIALSKKTKPGKIDDWYWPRYQYGVKFGVVVIWYKTKGKQLPKNLESQIMGEFYDRYLSNPVANGAFSFRKRKI